MRNPNWLFLAGIGVFVLATALCSVASFAVARQVAVDLGESGLYPASIGDVLRIVQGATPTSDAPAFSATLPAANATLPPIAATATDAAPTPIGALPTQTPATAATISGRAIPTLAVPGSSDGRTQSAIPTRAANANANAAQTPNAAAALPSVDIQPTNEALLAQYAWQNPRRFNLLLLGIDQRRGEQGPFRTDTIIVVSIDPVRRTAGMLSIPRDLYVPIPGYVTDRINNANVLGEANAFPGGGPALVARTLRDNLGINVDKYVLVNFDFFTTVVDLVAPQGVEVCPPGEIRDDAYPDGSFGIMSIYFPAGCQRLAAEELLQYARTRHGNSDFDRSQRQQEVIQAAREEVLSAGGIANFIGQAPLLWDELSDSYRTNMTLEELISLGLLLQDLPRENITTGVISTQETRFATTASGDEVLIPNYNAINFLMDRVFNAPPGAMVATASAVSSESQTLSLAEMRTRAEAEGAIIGVYNNTDVAGLAGQTRDWLASRQVTVRNVGNMPVSIPRPNSAVTTIIDYTGSPWTARYLAALLDLPPERVQTTSPSTTGEVVDDVLVIVGTDVQPLLRGQ
jgi:LCP family protein required for cell wall assembly